MTNSDDLGSDCRHHWKIESPNGPTSRGECVLCGEEGEFKNSIPISGWDRSGAQRKKARQAQS